MPGITERGRRSHGIGIIRGADGDDEPERPPIRYCPDCGGVFGNKILVNNEPKPEDYYSWMQCNACGRIKPVHEAKIEDKTVNVIPIADNPFDYGHNITGTGNKIPKDRRQKEWDKIRERIDREKDPDIKRELKKGAIVEIIEESIDY